MNFEIKQGTKVMLVNGKNGHSGEEFGSVIVVNETHALVNWLDNGLWKPGTLTWHKVGNLRPEGYRTEFAAPAAPDYTPAVPDYRLTIEADSSEIDEAIEKAMVLKGLLEEIRDIELPELGVMGHAEPMPKPSLASISINLPEGVTFLPSYLQLEEGGPLSGICLGFSPEAQNAPALTETSVALKKLYMWVFHASRRAHELEEGIPYCYD